MDGQASKWVEVQWVSVSASHLGSHLFAHLGSQVFSTWVLTFSPTSSGNKMTIGGLGDPGLGEAGVVEWVPHSSPTSGKKNGTKCGAAGGGDN
jgi:hypothetical protein